MKASFLLAIVLSMLSPCLAEEVEVFISDTKSHDIEWGESGDEETTSFLLVHRIGKLVGKIDTGESPLSELVAGALAHDSSHDPFFGPGVNYIVKDTKGQHFVLFFEFEEGHPTFNGMRMAINKATLIDPKLGVYLGNPYDGASFDKNVLAQLKKHTQQMKKEAATE